MTREEMIAAAQAQAPTMGYSLMQDPSASFGGGVPMAAVPAPMPQPVAAPMPSSDMPDTGTLTAEQMRHSMTQLAPMAPPLAAQPAPAQDYQLSMTPHESSYARKLALGEVKRGEAMEKLQGTQMFDNRAARNAGIIEEGEGTAELNQVKAARQDEQHEIDEQAVTLAQRQAEDQKAMVEQAQLITDKQMRRVQSAADEASQASIHNFWADKSAGSRVLGVLSQMLAGAANGLAGNPSAPTPLDRIIQRDMEMQQINLQQKNRNVDTQRGLLRDMQDKLGSQMQANAAYYQAAWKRIGAMSNSLASKFATPEADAANKQVNGIVQQRLADSSDKLGAAMYGHAIQQQQHGINALNEDDRTSAQFGAAAAAGKQSDLHDRFVLPGTKGEVSAQTYSYFKDAAEGYTGVMAQARAIKQVALDYKAGKISEAEAIQRYNSARGDLVEAQRKIQNTGAAMSAQEFQNLQTQLPELTSHFLFPASWNADIPSQVDRIVNTSSRKYFAHVSQRIKGVELDPNDPDYGQAVSVYRTELAAQHASGVR